ncbi:MAG: hypothetical protein SGJ18_00275 [Pseudomonadota bacterium]|nr:hypothetical protein [Pseudomonadota bacterium]
MNETDSINNFTLNPEETQSLVRIFQILINVDKRLKLEKSNLPNTPNNEAQNVRQSL